MSCCNCLKIQILSPITGIPDRFKQDGRLYLDLTSENVLELSKSLSRLSVLDTIEDEAAIEISIPYTPKNDIIARFVRNHNLLGNDYAPLSVIVQEGSIVHLTFTELQFTSASDAGRTYSAKLQRSTGHWLRGAIEKYLNTVDFGTFEFTAANLSDNWSNDTVYNDGDQGVWFPLVHYGGWFAQNSILVEDFRPWFHALSVLQKGFCEIGWNFRCPVLETPVGRQFGCYILDEAIGQDEASLNSKKFYATKDAVSDGNLIVSFPDIDFDNSGAFDGTSYSDFVISDFTAVVDFEVFTGDKVLTVQMVKELEDGSREVLAEYTGTGFENGSTVTVTLEAKDIQVSYNQYVFVVFNSPDGLYIDRNGYFKNNPRRVPPQKGDILELKDLVHHDYTLLDFLKGVAHQLNGRFKTDWVNKTVWLYAPYDAEWYTEGVDGFYESESEDITELIIQESEEITVDRTAQARYVQLQYKNSSDAYVQQQGLEDETPLYYKEADLGSGFIEDTQVSDNPFFEPTVNAIINKFPAIAPETVTYNPDIPHLWDNTEGKISYKIAPRFVFFFGYVYQIYDDGGLDVERKWRFESTTESQVPYALQKANTKYAVTPLSTPIEITELYGAYGGDVQNNDFYNLAYARELLTRKFATRSGFSMLVNAQRYRNTDFRKLYRIYYNGRTFFARMEEINAYTTCSDAPAQIVIRPEPYIGDICADTISVDPGTCQNTPRIDITVSVSGDYISASADNSSIDSPIASEAWEYSTNEGASWTSYTPPNQISGFEEVIFRREVSFSDGCPTKTVTRTGSFNTACQNEPGIALNYNDGTNTISASGTGSFNSTIDTDVWEVSIDEASFVSYTEGNDINGFTTITFRRTVNYTNACPETIVTATQTVEGEQCDNNPVIQFTQIGNSKAYLLSIDETNVQSTISAVVFQISDNNGATFRHHMGELIPRYPTTIVRAIVYYSDGCPVATIESTCP